MTYRGYIFDLDGVLTDTAHFHNLAWLHLAQDLGLARVRDEGALLSGLRACVDLCGDGVREVGESVLRARRDRDDGGILPGALLQHRRCDNGCEVVLVEQQDSVAAAGGRQP